MSGNEQHWVLLCIFLSNSICCGLNYVPQRRVVGTHGKRLCGSEISRKTQFTLCLLLGYLGQNWIYLFWFIRGAWKISSCLVAKSCMALLLLHGLLVHQPPLSMGFPRQEYWSRLQFPSLGDIPDTGIKPVSPAWQADSLPLSHLGSLQVSSYPILNTFTILCCRGGVIFNSYLNIKALWKIQ